MTEVVETNVGTPKKKGWPKKVTPKLGFFRLHPMVNLPVMGTKGSACYDLAYCAAGKTAISGHDHVNNIISNQIGTNGSFEIRPFERLLVPTGLIMDIPEGYSVRVHPRSGLSVKNGLTLINCEGIVDHDYVEEVFITLLNNSNTFQVIANGTRLAQFELVKNLSFDSIEVKVRPSQKTNRSGGFGSTGV